MTDDTLNRLGGDAERSPVVVSTQPNREPKLFHLECPACEWDCIVGPPGVGDLGLMCPLCAGDSGRSVTLRTIVGPLPDRVEGHDAREQAP